LGFDCGGLAANVALWDDVRHLNLPFFFKTFRHVSIEHFICDFVISFERLDNYVARRDVLTEKLENDFQRELFTQLPTAFLGLFHLLLSFC
jgi:hypothetical protein